MSDRHSKSVARWLRIISWAIDRLDLAVDPATDRVGPEVAELVTKLRRLQVKVRFATPAKPKLSVVDDDR